jgi:uncharacterized membrane protein
MRLHVTFTPVFFVLLSALTGIIGSRYNYTEKLTLSMATKLKKLIKNVVCVFSLLLALIFIYLKFQSLSITAGIHFTLHSLTLTKMYLL